MIISRQLTEFIGEGKHSPDTDTDEDTATIGSVLGCVAISIRRTRNHRRTHIDSTISINADGLIGNQFV